MFILSFLGRLAQLVEQLTLNQRVKGSSPLSPSNLFKDLRAIHARLIFQKVTFDHIHFIPSSEQYGRGWSEMNASALVIKTTLYCV